MSKEIQMSDDLYNDSLDDAQVLINMALDKLKRAGDHLGSEGYDLHSQNAARLWLDLTAVCEKIDMLPALGEETK